MIFPYLLVLGAELSAWLIVSHGMTELPESMF